jgi:flavin-binding protein dodecin
MAAVRAELRRTEKRSAIKMQDHIYKIIELAGSSETSIEDAIQRAIARASLTLNQLRWFEVVQTRGHIENGKVRHYQVTLRVGFALDGAVPD